MTHADCFPGCQYEARITPVEIRFRALNFRLCQKQSMQSDSGRVQKIVEQEHQAKRFQAIGVVLQQEPRRCSLLQRLARTRGALIQKSCDYVADWKISFQDPPVNGNLIHIIADPEDGKYQSRTPPTSSGVQYVSPSNALNNLSDSGNRRGVHTAVRVTFNG